MSFIHGRPPGEGMTWIKGGSSHYKRSGLEVNLPNSNDLIKKNNLGGRDWEEVREGKLQSGRNIREKNKKEENSVQVYPVTLLIS